ncbi:hypothetical protein B0H63DRAFT_14430 [Podospora didyma]|uniref:MARVEL domain-containing protein n=1 Tax=Podospora didyma TaxID=330526 RepID=A0AAE0P4M7_9PEZI|nr:hypothetical protein B0H63DRAFT_14430 [Podospora didyma]
MTEKSQPPPQPPRSPPPATIQDRMSLRPQGPFSYTFIVIRLVTIISLIVITGITGNFVTQMVESGQGGSSTLNAILFFAIVAFLWAAASWHGYSKRILPYRVTWIVDLVWIFPFAVIAMILNVGLSGISCADIAKGDDFTVVAPVNTPYGKMTLGKGSSGCFKLSAVWGLSSVVCISFAISAMMITLLFLGDRQLAKAQREAAAAAAEKSGKDRSQQLRRGQQSPTRHPPRNQRPDSQNSWDSTSSYFNEKDAEKFSRDPYAGTTEAGLFRKDTGLGQPHPPPYPTRPAHARMSMLRDHTEYDEDDEGPYAPRHQTRSRSGRSEAGGVGGGYGGRPDYRVDPRDPRAGARPS